jgi:hypothetical protein
VSAFSDDGQWWWDGATWVATNQVVLPQLPPTEFEKSGKLKMARLRAKNSGWLYWPNQFAATLLPFSPLAFVTGVPLMVVMYRSWRDFRLWMIDQLELATAYLLGADEPMVAGEGAWTGDPMNPDLAVVVTADHVVVLRIDTIEGQPRWIALARRAADVEMVARHGPLGLGSFLEVTSGGGRWMISGRPGAFESRPVLEAWRKAAGRPIRSG